MWVLHYLHGRDAAEANRHQDRCEVVARVVKSDAGRFLGSLLNSCAPHSHHFAKILLTMTIRNNGCVGSPSWTVQGLLPLSSATTRAALALSDEYVASHDFRHAFHKFQNVVPHPVCRDLV
jgi:hypothetical protein